jgi:organic hydroperoxide reductase OsmC/OhrA
MHPYPHTYIASSAGRQKGPVAVTSSLLSSLDTAAPPEFGGPPGVWSPETLLCASIADCFILTFRAVARVARFEWTTLECRVEGILEQVDQVTQFTRFTTFAKLTIGDGSEESRARELLERAEHGCLIANSLRGFHKLETEVVVLESPVAFG